MVGGLKGLMVSFWVTLVASHVYATNSEVVPGEFLVKFKNNVSASSVFSNFSKTLNVEFKRFIPHTKVAILRVKDSNDIKKTVTKLLDNSSVEVAEPNYIYRINRVPNDPDLGKLWGLINKGQADTSKSNGLAGVDIGAEKAWDIETGNKDLVVAVIDTGIDYTHKDLAENVWTNEAELNGQPGVDDDGNGFIDDIHGYDFVNRDGDPMDDHGHGSHCSGTIGAKGDDNAGIVGVAWNIKIMGLKFLSKEGSGTLENAVEAIQYATKMGVKIMSNSWGGGGYSEILKGAIEEANAKGIVFTAAAGNSSGNNDENPSYPASYNVPNVISVAAVDNKGSMAYFSCYGRHTVHVAAPGVNVFSSIPGGYDSWSGTSMATPHVSGVVALLLSHEPNLTPEEVKNRLIRTSKPLAGLKGRVASNGMVDAYMALTNQQAPPDPNDPENWGNVSPLAVSTDHPYLPNTSQSWVVEIGGAKEMSLHFDKFDMESRFDKVVFSDRDGKKLAEMTGDMGETWSPVLPGDYVKMTFTSDQSVQKYGFDLSKAAYR